MILKCGKGLIFVTESKRMVKESNRSYFHETICENVDGGKSGIQVWNVILKCRKPKGFDV
jgi:hypothetical protein